MYVVASYLHWILELIHVASLSLEFGMAYYNVVARCLSPFNNNRSPDVCIVGGWGHNALER